jgi:predicted SAM-dependent methyltransferase
MKLHLGCGKRYIPGFVHIDLADFDHIDFKSDVRKLSMIESKSVDLVYACQILEYFDRSEVKDVLNEWKRVLKVGGILRLSTPNFKVISTLYQAGFSLDYMLGTLYGKWGVDKEVTIYHRTTYDEPSLTKVLKEAGFGEVNLWDWRQTEHHHIDDFSQAYFPHMDKEKGMLWNLNLQAKKL